ncbi:MAG TPA: 3'(2'),5'-bisphosphate nucleotidase [Thermodesulfobacteriota bacterium]|nr:3'(2'),5'-bisphosphate nucleotidase [Thermodesulfobacteriota bacterium]
MDENSLEVLTAVQAVRKASELSQRVRRALGVEESLLKSDRSPVTIADFGSQAILCKMIKEKFPRDAIVAEENSEEIRKPDRSGILGQVTDYVNYFMPGSSPEDICSWIDLGSRSVADRYWAMDPIDGTQGFLRNDQYAIALALVEYGTVMLGILACPNLCADQNQPGGEKGCLFLAIKGRGSVQIDLPGERKERLSVSKVTHPQDASFTESVESEHADHLLHQRLAQKLNISRTSLKMDSQAKYGVLARGEVTLYLRAPSSSKPGYKEKVWDHAAGSIIAEEAGGEVTDILGHPLDFSSGIKMEKNHGILASNGLLHKVVLETLQTLK